MDCIPGAVFKTSQVKSKIAARRRVTRRTGQIVKWAQPLNDNHTVWHPSSTAVTRMFRNQKHHQRRNAQGATPSCAAAGES